MDNLRRPHIFLAFVLTVTLVIAGYWQLWAGRNCFTHEDWVAISNHTYGLKDSNGWRPDKGFGMSSFFADAGMWHPWSPLTLWEKLWSTPEASYNSSVLILDLFVAVALLIFLLRILPGVNPLILAGVVPLVIFCEYQSAYHYARAFIALLAAFPLAMLIMFDFYQTPRWLDVFKMTLLMCVVVFLGTLLSISQLLVFGFAFTVLYKIYFRKSWKPLLAKMVFLYGCSCAFFALLAFWEFYSLGLEQSIVGYMREKNFSVGPLDVWPQWQGIVSFVSGILPMEAYPMNHDLAAFNYLGYRFSVQIVFPLIFISFLCRRSTDPWEFFLKWLTVIFFAHWLTSLVFPAYNQIFGYLANTVMRLITMYDFIFVVQVALIAIFIVRMKPRNVILENAGGRQIQRLMAFVMCLFYCCALAVCLFLMLAPQYFSQVMNAVLGRLLPVEMNGVSKELLLTIVNVNLGRLQEMFNAFSLIFFATSIFLTGVFLRDRWLMRWAAWPKGWVITLLLVNAFSLSWTVFPLNNKPMAWTQLPPSVTFKPTDRFYFMQNLQWEKNLDGFRKRWLLEDGTLRRSQIGLLQPPGLNISGFKSFATKDEQAFIARAKGNASSNSGVYKRLYYGESSIFSKLFDMAAVNYYYSDRPLENLPDYVVPFVHGPQLYVYKNTHAWPYFYLARRIQVLGDEEDLENPQPATAYVSQHNDIRLSPSAGKGQIRLRTFKYGRLVFDFASTSSEFLVVADAWHPFWKATGTGQVLTVIPANLIFKGVYLPAGTYQVTLYFDPSPYRFGLYVSLAAMVVFAVGFYAAFRRREPLRFLEQA